MISYSLAPRDFDQLIFSQKTGQWAKSTYLARDVFGPVTNDYPAGYLYVVAPSYNRFVPSVTLYGASTPVMSRNRIMVGFQTLALSDGEALPFATWTLAAPGGSNSMIDEYQIVRSGATYSIRLKHHTYGYSTLHSGVVPGTWYTVGGDIYKDKVRPFAAGAYLADVSGGHEYADRAYCLAFFGSVKFQPWFANAYVYHGHDGRGSDLVTVNDLPADGEAIYIKQAYLVAGKSSGDVIKSTITAGVIASTPSADGKWLRALHLGGNVYGGSKKTNRTGGVWGDEDWEV